MAERADFNATLWAVSGPREITCFRVTVDGNGMVLRTTVADFNGLPRAPSFDQNLRAALVERYGPTTQVLIEADGGAGFVRFQQEQAAGRSPTPPHTPASPAAADQPAAPPTSLPSRPGAHAQTAQAPARQRGLWEDHTA